MNMLTIDYNNKHILYIVSDSIFIMTDIYSLYCFMVMSKINIVPIHYFSIHKLRDYVDNFFNKRCKIYYLNCYLQVQNKF